MLYALAVVLLVMEQSAELASAPPPNSSSPAFAKQTLSKDFVAEGCAVADFNGDGHRDLCAGRYIWLGPDFARRVGYTPERNNGEGMNKTPYRADTGYSDYFLQFARDFNGDGACDILVYGLPGTPASLFVNPGHAALADEMNWTRHDLFGAADGESPDFVNITGDLMPELLCHTEGQFGFAELNARAPFAKAVYRAITAKSAEGDKAIHRYTHGYGAGDVNGDGRSDLLTSTGWYEQPDKGAPDALWPFHAANFGEGGAQMYALDVNGDGRADVVTSIKAHSYGLSWFEQNLDGTFTERVILGRHAADNANGAGFSQIHAVRVIDLNGDDLVDIVTGKRRWAHGPMGDDEPMAPPVVCWFECVRDAAAPGGARFIKHEIDADSGVGTQLFVGAVNADSKPDIAVANKHGVFVFLQQ